MPDALLGLGFGFVEVGTVTPLPQAGNPRPRIFRLERDQAVINRLGFNNEGHEAVAPAAWRRGRRRGIVGVNIGANKDSADRIADYAAGVARFAGVASYLAVNISSPNTPGLRDMQERAALAELLARVIAARERAAKRAGAALPQDRARSRRGRARRHRRDGARRKASTASSSPTRPSRAPALGDRARAARRAACPAGRCSSARRGAGALRRLLGRSSSLIGVGGVDSPEAALRKDRAGADLVQLYTGLVFRGPDCRAPSCRPRPHPCERGFASIGDAVGCETEKLPRREHRRRAW